MAEQVQIDLLINTGSSPKNLGEVKQSIKDINKAISEVEFGSENFKKLDAVLKNNRETVRNLKKEYDTMQNISIFAKSISSAFGIATSAVGLFGDENKELNETLTKVASAFALVQSIQQFTEGLKLAESANKALNASLLLNPYVIITASIVAAAAALYYFSTAGKTVEKTNEEVTESLQKLKQSYEFVNDEIERKYKLLNSTTTDPIKLAENEVKKIGEQIIALKEKYKIEFEIVELQKKSKKNLEEYPEEYNKLLDLTNDLKIAENKLNIERLELAKKTKEEKDKIRKQQEDDDKALLDELYKANVDFAEKELENYKKSLEEKAKENERLEKNFIIETKEGIEERLTLYDLESEKRIDDLRKSGLSEIEIQKIISDGRIKIIEEENEKIKKSQQEQTKLISDKAKADLNELSTYMQATAQLVTSVGDLINQTIQQQVDERIAMYEKESNKATETYQAQLDQNLISQEEYNSLVASSERNLAKERRKEQHKAFVANKAIALVNASIATALSVIQMLANPGGIPGVVLAALAAATGVVSIATIAAQKEPAYAKGGVFTAATGGMVTGNGTGTSDSVNARLSNGESVINARSTTAFSPILSAINQLGGGIAFPGQKPIQRQPNGVSSNVVSNNNDSMNISVSISEAEVTRVQSKVKKTNNRRIL